MTIKYSALIKYTCNVKGALVVSPSTHSLSLFICCEEPLFPAESDNLQEHCYSDKMYIFPIGLPLSRTPNNSYDCTASRDRHPAPYIMFSWSLQKMEQLERARAWYRPRQGQSNSASSAFSFFDSIM